MGGKSTDIVLFVEHVARELDIACAIKHLAGKRQGLSVELSSIVSDRKRALTRYDPGVVALPFCWGTSSVPIWDILMAWPDAVFVNLAYEQIFRRHQRKFKVPKGVFARQHVLHHAWGDFHAEFLRKNGVPSDNVFVNGNPTYALYREPYVSYFASKSDLAKRFGLDFEKRWVFIPENYGAAFGGDKAVRSPVVGGRSEADSVYQFVVDSLREAVGWWTGAAELGSAELIVRPRPTTPSSRLAQLCRDEAGQVPRNLHIIKEGSVREWILASDIVASSYSTTLIEASIAGKPNFMLAPVPFPDTMHAEWYDLVPNIESQSDFLEVVAAPASPTNSQPLRLWAERLMLSNGDPISGLVDYLAALCRGDRAAPNRLSPKDMQPPDGANHQDGDTLAQLRTLARRSAGGVLRRSGLKKPHLDERHEGDELDSRDIARRVSRWAEVLR